MTSLLVVVYMLTHGFKPRIQSVTPHTDVSEDLQYLDVNLGVLQRLSDGGQTLQPLLESPESGSQLALQTHYHMITEDIRNRNLLQVETRRRPENSDYYCVSM